MPRLPRADIPLQILARQPYSQTILETLLALAKAVASLAAAVAIIKEGNMAGVAKSLQRRSRDSLRYWVATC